MGAEDGHRVGRNLGQVLDEVGALGLQALDHVLVVHDFVTHVDRRTVFLQRALDDLDGTDDAGAKTARLGEYDFHQQPPGGSKLRRCAAKPRCPPHAPCPMLWPQRRDDQIGHDGVTIKPVPRGHGQLDRPRYDFITRVFSYGMDTRWKRTLIKEARLPDKPLVLDLASGTGDFSLLIRGQYPGARPVATDLTERMLALARQRGVELAVCSDACLLPFPDGVFDCVSIGYGLRNFPNLEKAAAEIARVTRPGGVFASLDFFLPANALWRTLYLGISTRRALCGACCFTGVRARILIYRIRSDPSFPSMSFAAAARHRLPARQPARFPDGRNRAALGRQGRIMKDRLRASDYRFIAVCLALLGGSIWFSARNFYAPFPRLPSISG